MSRPFIHLHNHTEFSLLDGAGRIERLVEKACKCGMTHAAISDHGNMYGVPKFVLTARKHGLKPIIGSEFYLAGKSRHEKADRDRESEQRLAQNPTHHQILWARNEVGYRNLMKLSSIGYSEGFHYKPRIDFEVLSQHAEGLAASTCCLASEVNQAILKRGADAAEEVFRRYLNLFGEYYFIEIQRHGIGEQDKCNAVLLQWAKKYNVKVIATNDVHYIDQDDAHAHDLLLALQTGADFSETNRFRFTDDTGELSTQFYFKTPDEMAATFHDVPEALENTLLVADACTFTPSLNGDLILPAYHVPPEFSNMQAYLEHLTWEGARRKYRELTTDIADRIQTELDIIRKMGFAGYFLIVQDFTNEARRRDVMVGPGRGSAAGSVVAYCIGIIDIDPLAYDLLFERFLNPDRISPPDIDIDFDDEGRQAVIDYVIERYGERSVCQIITFGTMGAKTAIRDVGRVLKISLEEVNRIAKFIPEKPGMTFEKALQAEHNPDFYQSLKQALDSPDENVRKMLQYAKTLEGTARHTGIHAAGVIIAPGDVSDYVPTAINNNKDRILTTQYDGPMAELAGLLKMDFLGLRTLSIIKTAVKYIQARRGADFTIDIDNVDLQDPKTYELYQRGETVATFQFESDGMRKYLRQLKPTNIEDLIAMNALYRPGPMDNIPSFIKRKHGEEPLVYPHPMLEPILRNTYGIMVYQEQIMLVARVMGGYTLGEADLLRRAMGKKKKDVMEKERARFVAGAEAQGVPTQIANDVFDLMEKFAEYGFNKSHSAAYSILAFRTAYLKANYPQEYMAAVLSHNQNEIDKITFFIEECRRMGIEVLPPCVNSSEYTFSVSDAGEIRFGLGAIKGLGEASARAIMEERKKGGTFRSIFDLTERVPSKFMSKKTLECLAKAGALDSCGGLERARYIVGNEGATGIDRAIQWGNRKQAEKNSQQVSLFGGGGNAAADMPLEQPEIPHTPAWTLIERLNFEREVIGFYLSAHPLDDFKVEIDKYADAKISDLAHYKEAEKRDFTVAGIVTAVQERKTRKGTSFLNFTLEDKHGAIEITLFGSDYAKFSPLLTVNNCVLLKGYYETGYRDNGEKELKVREILLLEGLLENRAKEVIVEIHATHLTENLVLSLEQLCLNFKGGCNVKFFITEESFAAPLQLVARAVQVRPVSEFFTALGALDLIYKVR